MTGISSCHSTNSNESMAKGYAFFAYRKKVTQSGQ
nr:MAG TPA: hypothetical protein [Caudoviricetes sp.]